MARLARLYVPDQPQHVILRGLDQQPAFVDDQDYELFIDCLKAASRDHHLSIHAYALMPGAVQLLVTPTEESSLPKAMQAVGRRYVAHFNRRYARRGTLWEGRYRATVIEGERYFLLASRVVEMWPVRAQTRQRAGRLSLVELPASHRPHARQPDHRPSVVLVARQYAVRAAARVSRIVRAAARRARSQPASAGHAERLGSGQRYLSRMGGAGRKPARVAAAARPAAQGARDAAYAIKRFASKGCMETASSHAVFFCPILMWHQ